MFVSPSLRIVHEQHQVIEDLATIFAAFAHLKKNQKQGARQYACDNGKQHSVLQDIRLTITQSRVTVRHFRTMRPSIVLHNRVQ